MDIYDCPKCGEEDCVTVRYCGRCGGEGCHDVYVCEKCHIELYADDYFEALHSHPIYISEANFLKSEQERVGDTTASKVICTCNKNLSTYPYCPLHPEVK